ncbi:class I mannose-6-phosphate isomerase [Paenibacillus lemnae]|uniref:Mannose-6-phosphate isomerase n=1 Tax=Paenibacillus lemnae TaxID=1330551 RepID=A0A848MAE4_PAELE|nr:class I mannose-6-phosphate isomerase [Paenibacillus lemnae]NMO96444.1 mannose-6-phosphate isomerase [Paenibacillus lemnae]
MTPQTTFQSHPVNRLTVQDQPVFMYEGAEAWSSLILSAYQGMKEQGSTVVLLDGTHGTDFDALIQALQGVCEREGIASSANSTSAYLKPEERLRHDMASYLTDNRAFGFTAHGVSPLQYFREDAQQDARNQLQSAVSQGGIHVLYGPGAALLAGEYGDISFYADFSRENQQLRHANGMGSFGLGDTSDKVETYKDCYFLQWPVWETYRREWLAHYETLALNKAFYIDMNQPDNPVGLPVQALKRVLVQQSRQPFRVKPFFAPGIWGGQYLKKLCDLPEEWPNCAWSFEPIAPENTLLIQVQSATIELPFTLLMEAAPEQIMGPRNVELFGDYFPIRFDYLDTMDGGKLSLQVHPKQSYIESTFNEHMTQQESYYIMKQEPGAKVYLGLKNGVTGAALLEAVEQAHDSKTPLPVSDYVNEYEASTGDLYLIPQGTVHCSGKDNLVLEISSTPWWFTFKIYDYLRLDADGKPRPMNPEHARHNIDDDMDTTAAENGLIARPEVVRSQGGNTEELLGQRDDLLFQVKRLKLQDTWEDDTCGEFVMLNLVEGQRVRLVPQANENMAVEWGYAEAYIIPAEVGAYRLENLSDAPVTLIAASVNPDWKQPLLPFAWKAGKEAGHDFR